MEGEVSKCYVEKKKVVARRFDLRTIIRNFKDFEIHPDWKALSTQ